jgi:DNA-binding NarL/FixJ family response regulator
MLCDPDGAAALARLRVASPETRVALFISVDAHWLVPDSADALVSPDIEAEELVQCVASLAARRRWPGGRNSTGGPPRSARRGGIATPLALLSFRERQVVQGVVSGKRNGEIAQEMGISEGTVKLHLHRIYVKLGVSGRLALYTKLMRAQQAGR